MTDFISANFIPTNTNRPVVINGDNAIERAIAEIIRLAADTNGGANVVIADGVLRFEFMLSVGNRATFFVEPARVCAWHNVATTHADMSQLEARANANAGEVLMAARRREDLAIKLAADADWVIVTCL